MNADDVRKMLDSVFDLLSPAKAQEIAKGLLGDDRREQAQKLAGDLMDSAQRNRERVRELISREVATQMKSMGVATQGDLDALERRVRELEGAASGGSGASKRTGTRRASSAGTAAPKRVAAGSPRAKRSATGSSGSTAASPGPAAEPPATRPSRAGSTRRQPPSPQPPTP